MNQQPQELCIFWANSSTSRKLCSENKKRSFKTYTWGCYEYYQKETGYKFTADIGRVRRLIWFILYNRTLFVCCDEYHCCSLVIKSCPTLHNPMDCTLPGSSVQEETILPRQEYWSGLPFSSPGDLPNPGIKPMSPALAGRIFTTKTPGKP